RPARSRAARDRGAARVPGPLVRGDRGGPRSACRHGALEALPRPRRAARSDGGGVVTDCREARDLLQEELDGRLSAADAARLAERAMARARRVEERAETSNGRAPWAASEADRRALREAVDAEEEKSLKSDEKDAAKAPAGGAAGDKSPAAPAPTSAPTPKAE